MLKFFLKNTAIENAISNMATIFPDLDVLKLAQLQL